jgi:predicted nucleotidyltransferase
VISEDERLIITQSAKKFGAISVVLFGSSIISDTMYNDIDIGVKGIVPRLFFKFYGELIRRLPRPVDVIDLSHESLFNSLIEEKGQKILG